MKTQAVTSITTRAVARDSLMATIRPHSACLTCLLPLHRHRSARPTLHESSRSGNLRAVGQAQLLESWQ
jgi:hypothetical protein